MYLIVNNYNKTYCLFGGFYEKNTKNLYNFIFYFFTYWLCRLFSFFKLF